MSCRVVFPRNRGILLKRWSISPQGIQERAQSCNSQATVLFFPLWHVVCEGEWSVQSLTYGKSLWNIIREISSRGQEMVFVSQIPAAAIFRLVGFSCEMRHLWTKQLWDSVEERVWESGHPGGSPGMVIASLSGLTRQEWKRGKCNSSKICQVICQVLVWSGGEGVYFEIRVFVSFNKSNVLTYQVMRPQCVQLSWWRDPASCLGVTGFAHGEERLYCMLRQNIWQSYIFSPTQFSGWQKRQDGIQVKDPRIPGFSALEK